MARCTCQGLFPDEPTKVAGRSFQDREVREGIFEIVVQLYLIVIVIQFQKAFTGLWVRLDTAQALVAEFENFAPVAEGASRW
ncbi:hypothetical protein MW887_006961 [Aspergillus wentii]|nr:hypothetical protein MW887_006961 [Aspergillus wentii]